MTATPPLPPRRGPFTSLLAVAERRHDELVSWWASEGVEAAMAWLLVILFLGGLGGILLDYLGLLPPMLADMTPTSAFEAVNLSFTVLLFYEIMALILALARSVSISLGKQFEILCLILIRQSFKGLSVFGYPFSLEGHTLPLLHVISNGVGALVIFVLLGFYYRLQKHRCQIRSEGAILQFIAVKKLVSLLLLAAFVGAAAVALERHATGHHVHAHAFFASCYTILIFFDILIMLVALRYQPGFPSLFRNSGYALSTLLIRLSLVADPFYDAGLGLVAILFAIGLTVAYNTYTSSEQDVRAHAATVCSTEEESQGPVQGPSQGLMG